MRIRGRVKKKLKCEPMLSRKLLFQTAKEIRDREKRFKKCDQETAVRLKKPLFGLRQLQSHPRISILISLCYLIVFPFIQQFRCSVLPSKSFIRPPHSEVSHFMASDILKLDNDR